MDMSLGSPDAKRANTNQHSGLDLYNDDGAGGDESTRLTVPSFFSTFIHPPLDPSLDPSIPVDLSSKSPPSLTLLSLALNQTIRLSVGVCCPQPSGSTAY
jgi:hypothetical protein